MGDFTPMPDEPPRPPRRKGIFAHADFNLDALLSLAADLRGGRPCTVDVTQRPKAGRLNWVIFITFDDGIEWVFRSPRRSKSTKTESHYKMTISEASTLKYLGKHSSVPVPEVYSFSGSHDNEIGLPYILMSKASGRALSEYDWPEAFRIPGYTVRIPLLPLADRDREKIMGQLGSIMPSLSGIHFDKIGSLFEAEDGSGDCSVGECLSPSLVWEERDQLQGIDRGPFDQESQYLSSLISAFVSHAKELWLGPHVLFAPIPEACEYPHWNSYRAAVNRWRDFVGDGRDDNDPVPYLRSGGDFVLSHPDLHVGNIFVDQDFNVTCIIDWGSASAGPPSELLATPGLSGSIWPPTESLTAAFRAGFCRGGKKVDPEQWVKSEMMWRFSRLVRMLSIQDYTLFKALYELVYREGSDDIPRMFRERSMQEHEDEEEEEEEEEDGAKKDTVGAAVARKLKMMAEMNPNFCGG
ncbi:hypothetical protein ACJZ2D_016290 [Fusarium nematophilum]